MIHPGDVLPYAGLACTIACLLAALLGRWRRRAAGAAAVVLALAFLVPPPLEAARTAELHLHPFPVSLLNIILATAAMLAGSLLRLLALGLIGFVRRATR